VKAYLSNRIWISICAYLVEELLCWCFFYKLATLTSLLYDYSIVFVPGK
jgi:hypothetical protein